MKSYFVRIIKSAKLRLEYINNKI